MPTCVLRRQETSGLLCLHGLTVASNGVRLLERLDLTVEAGEVVGLTGRSGCGKTTLLRAVAGLIDPVEGEVKLDGRRAEDLGWPAYRRRVVLVDQRPVLLDATVRANLDRPFRYNVAETGFPAERAAELLDRLELGSHRMLQDARSLSVGQQQRVCLIRALLVEPAVLLLDEPTSALDQESLSAVESLIREQAHGRGLACLIVTHDIVQIERWCDRRVDLTPNIVEPTVVPPTNAKGGGSYA